MLDRDRSRWVERRRGNGRWAALIVGAVLVSATAVSSAEAGRPLGRGEPATYQAEIRRTAFGVPHVKAADYASLGFGLGYAYAEDNVCEFADRLMTTSGQRSRYFGSGGGNLNSDVYHQSLIASGEVERLLAGDPGDIDTPSPKARALVRGYTAGISRYIRDVGVDDLPDPRCRGAAWVREVDELDMWRAVHAGIQPVEVQAVATAQPPATSASAAVTRLPVAAGDPLPDESANGSNAYALGSEATVNGHGALLGNPHFPWTGHLRFYRMHMTIPGELNIVGAGILNTPIVGIGHNESMAWTHTVSTARRFGYHELQLAPGDPTAYVFDGEVRAMTRRDVTVDVLQTDGTVAPVARTLYQTHLGPMVRSTQLPWTATRGFALHTPPVNLRSIDQYLDMAQAGSVRDLYDVVTRYQATGFNTIASDASGEVMYGDLGAIPNVTEALAAACIISPTGQMFWANRVPVLDGSRSECEWGTDPDSTMPGVFGPGAAPQLFRTDHVSQMNDSYWLTNPSVPLTGLPRIYGDESTQRSLRTRLGLVQIEQRLAGTDDLPGTGFDLERIQQVLFGNRNHAAELSRDALVTLCRDAVASGRTHLAAACDVLEAWDLRVDLDSRGAHLFRRFAESGGLRWAVPFDPADPVNTPNTLDVADSRVLDALESAVETLIAAGIPLDARWGDVQSHSWETTRIPMHGGAGGEGVFNVITSQSFRPGEGWTQVVHGSSWIMTVEFTDDGPRSEGVLTYSQSTNPLSPHRADQTQLYSQEGWDDLRLSEQAVVDGTISTTTAREGKEDCKQGGWREFERPQFADQSECVSYFAELLP
jgi:acyl-homoserine-lactone acylase